MRLEDLPDAELERALTGEAEEILRKRERKRQKKREQRKKRQQERLKRQHIQSLSTEKLQEVAEDPRTMSDSRRREVWGYVFTVDGPNMGKDEAVDLARQELRRRQQEIEASAPSSAGGSGNRTVLLGLAVGAGLLFATGGSDRLADDGVRARGSRSNPAESGGEDLPVGEGGVV